MQYQNLPIYSTKQKSVAFRQRTQRLTKIPQCGALHCGNDFCDGFAWADLDAPQESLTLPGTSPGYWSAG